MKNTQTQPTIELTVLRDQVPDYDYMPKPPSAVTEAAQGLLNGLHGAIEHMKLEARLIAHDAFFGTNYRTIRHELVRQKRNAEFERSIGIVAIKR
jgi:hypothetical protein